MGYKPGPLFSEILRAVEDAQLEGLVNSKKEAKDYAEREFGRTKRQVAERRLK
jgi:hypothetical protein